MSNGLDDLGRARFQGLLLLVLAFVAGAIAGVAGDRAMLMRAQAWRPPAGPPPRAGLPPVLEQLDLSPGQRARVDSLFDMFRPRMDAVVQQTRPRLDAIADSLDRAVRAALTPAQQKTYDRDLAELRRRRAQMPPRGGRFGAPGGSPPYGPPPGGGPPPYGPAPGAPPPGGPPPPP
ncbi:MAG TPA: hypothetical protein VFK69_00750 [Candidatus Eisenbacteria bacterium]|nr:hypothetical protein [Candidatus Eisenbacteria bacterium]